MPDRPVLARGTFLALTAAAVSAPHPADAAVALHGGSAGDDDATPFLYAMRSGLFARNGLDGTLQRLNSGSAVTAAVVGGTYEVGKSSLLALITAHTRGLPVVIVAPAGEYNAAAPVAGLLVRADGPIKAAADLNGKVVAVSSLNDLYTISTRAWIDAHGGNSSTLKLVELPISAVPEALAQGRIDAGNVLEPELQFAIESNKVRVIAHPFDAIAPRFTFTAWFTRKDYADKNRDTIARFVRSIHDAAAYVNAHHAETVEALAEFTKLEPAVIGRSTRATAGLTLDPKSMQPVIDAAARYKAIPAPFDARELLDTGR